MPDTPSPMRLPLQGIRVLDLSRVLAGPGCAMSLADLGAEVTKIEHPVRGDDTRDWGTRIGENHSAYFNSVNRNKRSIGVALDTDDGRALVREMAAKADVVIQNFKFGTVERMGLDYETLRKGNPGLVYCSVAGYDPTGPEAARPGYDLVIQGEAGLMALNGETGQGPLKFGIAVVDLVTGNYAAQGIIAALFDRQRTGQGRHVQVALYDTGIQLSVYYGLEALAHGKEVRKFGNEHPSIVPYGVFEAADGAMVITVGNNGQFVRFCHDVIERPDLAADPRFATNTERARHRELLLEQIRPELKARQRETLVASLEKAGIPGGKALGILEALDSERTRRGDLRTTGMTPDGSVFAVLMPPYRLDGQRPPVRTAPPALGEQTDAVLAEAGLAADRIAELRRLGVIG